MAIGQHSAMCIASYIVLHPLKHHNVLHHISLRPPDHQAQEGLTVGGKSERYDESFAGP